MTRLQTIEHQGKEPELPFLAAGDYLVDHLFSAGPIAYGPSGAVPLSHSDIAAYQHNNGIELQPWEVRCLRRLSASYSAASHDAADIDCPPFFMHAPDVDAREVVSSKIKNVLGGRKLPRKGS